MESISNTTNPSEEEYTPPAWLNPDIPTDEVDLNIVPVQIDPSDPDTVPWDTPSDQKN